MLRIIDERWRKHLEAIEHLKEAVSLRAYGQKDPAMEFKKESYILFEELINTIYDDTVSYLLRIIKVDTSKEEEETKKKINQLNFVHNDGSVINRAEKRKEKKKTHKRIRVKR